MLIHAFYWKKMSIVAALAFSWDGKRSRLYYNTERLIEFLKNLKKELRGQKCILDLVFQAFFRRVRDGEAPFFPALQGARALQRLGVQNAWRRLATCARRSGRHGRLRVAGVGLVKIRGKPRNEGLSCVPARAGSQAAGLAQPGQGPSAGRCPAREDRQSPTTSCTRKPPPW
ncbi:MAG TPA: hypothetical protein VMK12_11780 [Anaeromyxobacteraceae bacterium]|nr:hypothetical protein [Anaeromyxobacteraceae bacterium]